MKNLTKLLLISPGIPIIIVLCAMYHQNPFWTYVAIATTICSMIWTWSCDDVAYTVSFIYVAAMTIVWFLVAPKFCNHLLNGGVGHKEVIVFSVFSDITILSWITWGLANSFLKEK